MCLGVPGEIPDFNLQHMQSMLGCKIPRFTVVNEDVLQISKLKHVWNVILQVAHLRNH